MNVIEALIIAIVEGLTEFLPVSSTGHMIITQSLLGMENTDFLKAFTVIIQFGAILSVVVLYWKRFFQSFDFYWKLFIAVLPAGIFGLLFGERIDALLENVTVVAVMLVLGGILMLFVDQWFDNPSPKQKIGWKKALTIGFFQCVAMVPGVSRSMATIVGGMITRLNRKNAAEFSFFLAVPTMAAAAGYKLYQLMKDPINTEMLKENMNLLLLGNAVAFIVAIIAIRFFIDFLTRYGFKAFGIYRIIVGSILLVLMLAGVNISMI